MSLSIETQLQDECAYTFPYTLHLMIKACPWSLPSLQLFLFIYPPDLPLLFYFLLCALSDYHFPLISFIPSIFFLNPFNIGILFLLVRIIFFIQISLHEINNKIDFKVLFDYILYCTEETS